VPVIERLANDGDVALDGGGVILVGERLAATPGALTAALALSRTTGARLAWVPRRAGDRGAVDGGCLPGLLPGGRPVDDAAARVDVGTVWGVSPPTTPGRDLDGILDAATSGDLGGLLVAGVDLDDLPDPAAARAALEAAGFVVSLELRESAVTELADVVFPVAAVAEKAGSFVNWEGRVRRFPQVFHELALPDLRVLAGIAEEMGPGLGFRTPEAAGAELDELAGWDGARATAPSTTTPTSATGPQPTGDELVLCSWKQMVDDGRMQDGDEHYRAAGRAPVALVSAGTLADLGLTEGSQARLTGPGGSVKLPVRVADLPDGVVWAPESAGGRRLRRDVGAGTGSVVRLEGGAA
jgi:NADH-quinone oxidoreductase subunit G